MRIDPEWSREKVAALLEAPVRALFDEGVSTRPIVDIRDILDELDRRDGENDAKED